MTWRNRLLGFSLAEVLMALAIFAAALVALMSVTLASLRISRKSSTLTAGASQADCILQREVSKVLADRPPGSKTQFFSQDFASPNNPWKQGTAQVGPTVYNYRMHTTTVQTGMAGNRMKRAFMVVTWWSKDGVRSDHGKMEARSSLLVNENERP